MPTVLERATVTVTPPVRNMLDFAAQQWPDLKNTRELMLRLMAEGASSLRERRLEAEYAQAYAEWDGTDDQALWDSTASDGLGGAE